MLLLRSRRPEKGADFLLTRVQQNYSRTHNKQEIDLLTLKKPLTPFGNYNPIAHAKAARLAKEGRPTPPQNEAEKEEQAKRAAARQALQRADVSLYSTTLHGY